MRTFAVDKDNNFIFGADGQIPLLTGAPAILQTARQYTQVRRGEMVFKADEGVPYAVLAWNTEPNEAGFEVSQRARLLQVPDVLNINTFEIIRVGEDLDYTANLETNAGELVVNGQL